MLVVPVPVTLIPRTESLGNVPELTAAGAVRLPIKLLKTLYVAAEVLPDMVIPLTKVDVPVAAVVIPWILFLKTLMPVPPVIAMPSTVALNVLPAAPTDMFVTVLLNRFAPVEFDEQIIPLTVGVVVMTPVKFIAEKVLFVME